MSEQKSADTIRNNDPTSQSMFWKSFDWLKNFFTSYIMLGVVLLLVGVYIQIRFVTPPSTANSATPEETAFYLSMLVELLKTIALAIIVAAIFTFAASTADFVSRISKELKEIVVERNFLANMDDAARKSMLSKLLQPTTKQNDVYGNIEGFIDYYIDRSLKLSNRNVRSHYTSECRVYYDAAINHIVAEYENSYTLYPTQNKFTEDIQVGMYTDNNSNAHFHKIVLEFPNSDPPVVLSSEEFNALPKSPDGQCRLLSLREYDGKHKQITVRLTVCQRGHDHWIQVGFLSMVPTDQLTFTLTCDEPLQIQEDAMFLAGVKHNKIPPKFSGQTKAKVTCNQWIEEGAGLIFIVAAPHSLDGKGIDALKSVRNNKHKIDCFLPVPSESTVLPQHDPALLDSPPAEKAIPLSHVSQEIQT